MPRQPERTDVTGALLWYVHDQGRGHLERARAVIPTIAAPVVVASGPGLGDAARRALGVPVVSLPSDVPAVSTPTTGPWHHAPASPEVRARGRDLAGVIHRYHCTTAVVDVSMEVAALCRLLGLRVVALRQTGHRADPAHRIGLASADTVWVPQHPDLEDDLGAVDERWGFSGPFSRFDGADARRGSAGWSAPRGTRLLVVVVGAGGNRLDLDRWAHAQPPRGWAVVIAGAQPRWRCGAVASIGHLDAVFPLLAAADVVMTSAGWATIADTVAAGTRLVVVPEPRPFDEQVIRARLLAARGLAVRCSRWPDPVDLSSVLDEAMELEPARWRAFHDGAGARRAGQIINAAHGSS